MVQGYHGGQSTVRHALQDFPVVIQCVLIPVIGSWLNTAPFNGQAVRILSSFHRPVQVLLPPPSPPITGKPGSIPIPNPSFLLLPGVPVIVGISPFHLMRGSCSAP